jgi:hypothetical protein
VIKKARVKKALTIHGDVSAFLIRKMDVFKRCRAEKCKVFAGLFLVMEKKLRRKETHYHHP